MLSSYDISTRSLSVSSDEVPAADKYVEIARAHSIKKKKKAESNKGSVWD